MNDTNSHSEYRNTAASSVFGAMRDDLRRSNLKRSLKQEYSELKDYMLDETQIIRLEKMMPLKRFFFLSWWLLKSMFFKLTPLRRILLVIGLLLMITEVNVSVNGSGGGSNSTHILGGFVILFVLMLELKDKLLAREELEAGRAVQKALMPEVCPNVPGWDMWLFTRSANEVGGDLVDCISIGESRFSVLIGDVAGKGLRAALLTAKLQSSVRALIDEFIPMSSLFDKLNYIFYRDSLRSIFASLLGIDLNSNSGIIKIINAGHLPPTLIRGTVAEKLPKGGPAIGLLSSSNYEGIEVELQQGDVMIAYSDGVTEAANEHGDFFGEKRVLESLAISSQYSIRQIGEHLISRIDKFRGDARAHDDISIILLRRQ